MSATTNSYQTAAPAARDAVNAALGAWLAVEGAVRFQLARGLLRYYELVWKGEAVDSEVARQARDRIKSLFGPAEN